MDCKELMVGDWVSYKDDPPYIVRGTSICEVVTIDNGIDHRNVMDDAINPIPLTEEILVKNGWRKEPTTIDGDYANWHGEIPICQEEDEFNYERIELTYVHQLQHLLRLCGVEKEITI